MKLAPNTKNFLLGLKLLATVLVTDGLYNNLQAQNQNQVTNTQIASVTNKITQQLKPEHKNEIQNLIKKTGNMADLYLKGCEFIDNQASNFNFTAEERFYGMVLILDFNKTSQYYNKAKVVVESNKSLQAIIKRALKSIGLSIQIKSLQDGTSSIDDSIRAQQKTISGQQKTISGQQKTISGQQKTMNELDRLDKHIDELTKMLNNMGK